MKNRYLFVMFGLFNGIYSMEESTPPIVAAAKVGDKEMISFALGSI